MGLNCINGKMLGSVNMIIILKFLLNQKW